MRRGLAIVVLSVLTVLVMVKTLSMPHWNCASEDEVVVIDHTCQHVDTLATP